MALTAATPFYKGRIVDVDTRWDIIASSVDCRTPAERGLTDEVSQFKCRTDAGLYYEWLAAIVGSPSLCSV